MLVATTYLHNQICPAASGHTLLILHQEMDGGIAEVTEGGAGVAVADFCSYQPHSRQRGVEQVVQTM